jgi:hypothetical protein
MNMRVDAGRRENVSLARDRFGRNTDDQIGGDSRHHIRIAGFPDSGDAPAFHPNVGFVNAGPVDDDRVGDHEVERAIVADACRLPHAVTQHFSATELAFVAIARMVTLHFGDQIRIR